MDKQKEVETIIEYIDNIGKIRLTEYYIEMPITRRKAIVQAFEVVARNPQFRGFKITIKGDKDYERKIY